jgi:hypothetical protein
MTSRWHVDICLSACSGDRAPILDKHITYDSTLSIVMSALRADITMDKVELNR